MREHPARVFGIKWADVPGESTHLSSSTSVLINICTRNIAHQKGCFERIDYDSPDASDYVYSRVSALALLDDLQVTF